MIQIFVENHWYISLTYDVSLDSPISTLKAAIEEAEGKPVAQQCLKFQGQELEDTRIFSSYNISDGSTVQLRGKLQPVFVKTLTGKTITCDVDLDAPILFLKMIVEEKERIPVDHQYLVGRGKQLESRRTLASYEIQREATINIVLRLRGGGSNALAYAVACCHWDGDMKHRRTKGLKLPRRGMMVVITEKRDKNWYSAREPDRWEEGLLPCHFVQIVRYLNDDFRQLDLNPNPESCSFPFTSASSRNVSETREIEDLRLNDPARELPMVPAGPLPLFRFPWAEPRIFSRGFANWGHSLVEISITYNREAVPCEPTILNVTLKCRAIDDRVSEVSIQITVPNGEVKDVQSPPSMVLGELGREGEMQAKFFTRNEQRLGIDAGVPRVGLTASLSQTRVTEEERSGTLPTTQMSITGDSLRGDTASWLITEATTLEGGAGLPAKLSDMSFTLTKQPESFGFDCLVRVGGGKKYHLKSSSSPWFQFLWK